METATDALMTSSQKNGVLMVQFNRAKKKNALTREMYTSLADILGQAAQSPEVRVLLITGSEDSFTSGNDLNDFLAHPPHGADSPVFRFLEAIHAFPKPLVAAVNGLAIGIGTTLLLHCDLVFASEKARFQLPFVNLALVPEAASSLLLPRLMGHQRAAELLMLGEMFGAQQAADYGLVNRVVADAGLMDKALEASTALAQKAPEAMRLTKMLLKQAMQEPVAEVMKKEGSLFAERLQSPEAQEVMRAFMERRQPDFSKF